jgi:hypothetical protein
MELSLCTRKYSALTRLNDNRRLEKYPKDFRILIRGPPRFTEKMALKLLRLIRTLPRVLKSETGLYCRNLKKVVFILNILVRVDKDMKRLLLGVTHDPRSVSCIGIRSAIAPILNVQLPAQTIIDGV